VTYVRFAFCGTVGEPLPGRALDTGIVRTLWMTLDEVQRQQRAPPQPAGDAMHTGPCWPSAR
jgi:hypothetical protein